MLFSSRKKGGNREVVDELNILWPLQEPKEGVHLTFQYFRSWTTFCSLGGDQGLSGLKNPIKDIKYNRMNTTIVT